MRPVTAKRAAEILNGRLFGDGGVIVDNVCIDSRQAVKNSLFAALPGEKADGHAYVAAAFENGASCALVREYTASKNNAGSDTAAIVVPNVAEALSRLAKYYRETLKIPIIGVTGSVGKTTTKELLAAVLAERYSVHKTPGNLNNELGVPLTIFGIEPWHDAAVVEMGISDFGEMTRLSDIVRPDIAVITLIGHAHLDKLGDRAGVLRAKTEILSGMDAGGKLIVNGDDAYLAAFVPRVSGSHNGSVESSAANNNSEEDSPIRKIMYGVGESCAVRAERALYRSDRVSCDIIRGSRRLSAEIPGYGEHLLYAALAAAAVGFELGLSDIEISRGLAKFETVGRRASMEDTGRYLLLDDCYNSNPTSCISALNSLSALNMRRVAILGDMLELGECSAALHKKTGEAARALGIDVLLCCGENSLYTAAGAGAIAHWYDGKQSLIADLPNMLRPGDAVLVKASRGMRFEDVAEAVKNN